MSVPIHHYLFCTPLQRSGQWWRWDWPLGPWWSSQWISCLVFHCSECWASAPCHQFDYYLQLSGMWTPFFAPPYNWLNISWLLPIIFWCRNVWWLRWVSQTLLVWNSHWKLRSMVEVLKDPTPWPWHLKHEECMNSCTHQPLLEPQKEGLSHETAQYTPTWAYSKFKHTICGTFVAWSSSMRPLVNSGMTSHWWLRSPSPSPFLLWSVSWEDMPSRWSLSETQQKKTLS